jgi:hypothetical protein
LLRSRSGCKDTGIPPNGWLGGAAEEVGSVSLESYYGGCGFCSNVGVLLVEKVWISCGVAMAAVVAAGTLEMCSIKM